MIPLPHIHTKYMTKEITNKQYIYMYHNTNITQTFSDKHIKKVEAVLIPITHWFSSNYTNWTHDTLPKKLTLHFIIITKMKTSNKGSSYSSGKGHKIGNIVTKANIGCLESGSKTAQSEMDTVDKFNMDWK